MNYISSEQVESALNLLQRNGYRIELAETFEAQDLADALSVVRISGDLNESDQRQLDEIIPALLAGYAAYKGLKRYGKTSKKDSGSVVRGAAKLAGNIAGLGSWHKRNIVEPFKKGNAAHTKYLAKQAAQQPAPASAPAATAPAAQPAPAAQATAGQPAPAAPAATPAQPKGPSLAHRVGHALGTAAASARHAFGSRGTQGATPAQATAPQLPAHQQPTQAGQPTQAAQSSAAQSPADQRPHPLQNYGRMATGSNAPTAQAGMTKTAKPEKADIGTKIARSKQPRVSPTANTVIPKTQVAKAAPSSINPAVKGRTPAPKAAKQPSQDATQIARKGRTESIDALMTRLDRLLRR